MNANNSEFKEFLKKYNIPPKDKKFDYYCSLSTEELLEEFEKWMKYEKGYSKKNNKMQAKKSAEVL